MLRKVARDRKCQPYDAALAGRISRLADLAIIGGHRSGIDDNAPRLLVGLPGSKSRGELGDHVECANQVDLDHASKNIEWVRHVLLAHGFDGGGNACTIHQNAGNSMMPLRLGKSLRDAGFIADIDSAE